METKTKTAKSSAAKTATANQSRAEIKLHIERLASRQSMRVVKMGTTRVALVEDESIEDMNGKNAGKFEPYTVYVYDFTNIALAKQQWVPGRVILKLQRQDVSAKEFEALAALLVD